MLDLLLRRSPGSADRELDRLGRVVEAAKAVGCSGEHDHAAGLPDGHRRADVLAEEEALERHRLR